nr:MAG TPA: hypothetical protein [Caudoviricetes sp.]
MNVLWHYFFCIAANIDGLFVFLKVVFNYCLAN